jgi:hypothetical protein
MGEGNEGIQQEFTDYAVLCGDPYEVHFFLPGPYFPNKERKIFLLRVGKGYSK